MADSPQQPDKFKVDRLSVVTAQITRFVERAKRLGMGPQVLDALEAIIAKLENAPLEWGDPQYALKHSGGMVLHGLHFPFVVHYAAFQPERVVCILNIKAFPRHPLEGE